MVSERDQELLQRDIDGDLTPDERARVRELLDRDPEARTLHEQLRAACAALAAIPPREAPRTLRPGVMRTIAALPERKSKAHTVRASLHHVKEMFISPLTKEAVMSPTKGSTKYSWLIAGAVVAIVAVVYFSFYYPPTPAGDAQGTIGAAQKYRSEQITDKDVVTGAPSASPFAEQIMADAAAMEQLGSAARDLNKAIAEYGARPKFDKTIAADLGAAAAALEKTISFGKTIGIQKSVAADLLGRTHGLEKAIVADLGGKPVLEKNTPVDLQRSAGVIELGATAAHLDMTARSLDQKTVLEKSSIADLQRTAVSLNQAAVLYSTSKLERSAVNDVLAKTAQFEKNAAPAFEKNITLDAKTVGELNKTAIDLGKSAFELGQKFPAEMRSTLDRNIGLESKTGVGQKATLDKNAPSEN